MEGSELRQSKEGTFGHRLSIYAKRDAAAEWITIEVIALHRDHVHSCWSWIGHMYTKYARQLEYVLSDPKMHMHHCVHARQKFGLWRG